MLDMDPVPSMRIELDGDRWKPPIRANQTGPVTFNLPGSKWAEDSRRKLQLLFALARALTAQHVIEPPMTFHTLMEFIEANCGYEMDFNGRVFVYLIALILNQKL